MKKQALVLSTKSNHEWARYYAEQITKEAKRYGVDVMSVDIRDADAKQRLKQIIYVEEIEFVVCFEGAGFLISSIIGPNWIDLLGSRIYAYFSQHPLYYKEELQSAQSWNISPRFTDAGALEYFCKYHVAYEGASTLISAGFTGINSEKELGGREIDILFPYDYMPSESYKKVVEEMPDSFRIIGERLLSELSDKPERGLEIILIEILDELGVSAEPEEVMDLMEMYEVIYEYVRNLYIERVLYACLDAGLEITVCGDGWEYFQPPENAVIKRAAGTGIPFGELLDMMGDSKMVLLNHAKHQGEISLTLMCAMANGAAVVSDRNPVLGQYFCDGKEIIYYENKQTENIGIEIKKAWADMAVLERIASGGKTAVRKMAGNTFLRIE